MEFPNDWEWRKKYGEICHNVRDGKNGKHVEGIGALRQEHQDRGPVQVPIGTTLEDCGKEEGCAPGNDNHNYNPAECCKLPRAAKDALPEEKNTQLDQAECNLLCNLESILVFFHQVFKVSRDRLVLHNRRVAGNCSLNSPTEENAIQSKYEYLSRSVKIAKSLSDETHQGYHGEPVIKAIRDFVESPSIESEYDCEYNKKRKGRSHENQARAIIDLREVAVVGHSGSVWSCQQCLLGLGC